MNYTLLTMAINVVLLCAVTWFLIHIIRKLRT